MRSEHGSYGHAHCDNAANNIPTNVTPPQLDLFTAPPPS